MVKIEKFKYLHVKRDTEYIETEIPIKKNGIYYLTGKENYWLISSGKAKDLQSQFVNKGIVGLGWSDIDLKEIKELSENDMRKLISKKYSKLQNNYKDEKSFKAYVTSIYNKFIRFVNEIKLGDIIVLKDRGSDKVYFGKVVSEAEDYSSKDLFIDDDTGHCNKIRRVQWLKSINKNGVGSDLRLAFTARHAISKIKREKVHEEINREIFTYFYRGNQLHIVFKVEKKDDISHDDFKMFQDYIHNIKQQCLEKSSIENNFNIKANVQSPGPIEFFGNPDIVQYIYKIITIASATKFGVTTYKNISKRLKIKNPSKEVEKIEDGFTKGN